MTAKKQLTFEERLTQLETIVREIEEGKIGLEESIKKYESGIGLLAQCRQILDDAELKIRTLQEQASGGDTPDADS